MTKFQLRWRGSSRCLVGLPPPILFRHDASTVTPLGMISLTRQTPEPGGYIQWGEPDFESIRIDKTKPENETKGLSELLSLFSVQDPRTKPTWLSDLPATLAAAGFDQVVVDKLDGSPHLLFMFHECGLMLYEIYCRKTKNEMMRKELNRILPLAVEETKQGAYTTAIRWTVVARKPAREA